MKTVKIGFSVEEFVDALNASLPDDRPKVVIHPGKVRDKLVHGGAVFCFVDREGGILKAESWSRPARGVRARLADMTPEKVAKITANGYPSTAWLYARR